MEDIFEAFIGSLYECFDFEFCYRFVEKVLGYAVDLEKLISTNENYKEQLMQYYQKQGKNCPKYVSISCIEGEDNVKTFTEGVLDMEGNEVFMEAIGNSKLKAQQEACRLALEKLGLF